MRRVRSQPAELLWPKLPWTVSLMTLKSFSLWLSFLLLPSFTASAWKENRSGIKFLPNLLRQNTCFVSEKCIFCYLLKLLQLLPLIPLILSIRSQWFDLSQSIHWILQFLSPPLLFKPWPISCFASLFAFPLPPHRHRHLTEQQPLSPSQYREFCKYTSCLKGKHFIHCS